MSPKHFAQKSTDVAQFMVRLRERSGFSARALELQILTATRPSEAAGAQWAEFNLAKAVWTIPAERMKAGKEHRVPLSAPAVAMLQALPRLKSDVYLFTGAQGRPLTTVASMALLKELQPGMTAHDFRSTFRDWAEATTHPREAIDATIAHRPKDAVEATYQRGDLFEKRARLMAEWAGYCE